MSDLRGHKERWVCKEKHCIVRAREGYKPVNGDTEKGVS